MNSSTLQKERLRTHDPNDELVALAVNANYKGIVHNIYVSQKLAVVVQSTTKDPL